MVAIALPFSVVAQSATAAPQAAVKVHVNTAIIPVPRPAGHTARQDLVLQRAREAKGQYDIEFIGDSITQLWETVGKNVWNEYYGKLRAINFGVGGDHTEQVLWRFEHGQLDGVHAKVAVVMIGTNNSNGKDYSESDILAGITAIVKGISERQPETKIILCAIFPKGRTFNPARGKILQVNQALARLDDGKHIFFLDFGSQFIENDGSISQSMMTKYLHPTEAGYKIWAAAMEPTIEKLLAEK